MLQRITILMLLSTLALLSTACDCDAESDAELCVSSGYTCGLLSARDSCDARREIACGACEAGGACQDNQCICVPETEQELCAAHGVECTQAVVVDGCGDVREITCDESCECVGESDRALCGARGWECGDATTTDSCDRERVVACGACEATERCQDNQCVCRPETDEELCAWPACGTVEMLDRCQQSRFVECEPCGEIQLTSGAIVDAVTSAMVEDAVLKLHRWPPAGAESAEWVWSRNYRASDPDHLARTTSGGELEERNFHFGDVLHTCAEDWREERVTAGQMYRVRVDRPDYVPQVSYRYHGAAPQECAVPICDDITREATCLDQDFELWPQGATYPKLPDLIIDPRNLEDHFWQCAWMPERSPHQRLIGLRITAAVPNVGMGGFHLQGVPNEAGNRVVQHIDWSDGTRVSHELDVNAFRFDIAGEGLRFYYWVRLRFIEPRPECAVPFGRPEDCVTHESDKYAFCLGDTEPFDRELEALYESDRHYLGSCENFTQGVSAGWKDIYGTYLPRQVLIAGTMEEANALGLRWIEMEANPEGVLIESDRSNNRARIAVQMPVSAEALCDDADRVLDCTGPRDGWNQIQRWQCPIYFEFMEP